MTYKIYGLIHPVTDTICYIGCTTRTLKERLAQHNNPIKTNPTKIAKLKRSLKTKRFSIVLIKDCSSKEDMFESEIHFIKYYRDSGFKIYNISDGGEHFEQTQESIKKMLDTRRKNNVRQAKVGEDVTSSKLTNNEVLEIYSLIKEFYSNEDIIKKFNKPLNRTWLASIRFGNTWKFLFKEHFSEPIPSLKNFGTNSYNGRIKMKIVELLDKGYEPKKLMRFFNKINVFDMIKIKNQEIWKPVWNNYYKFRKCPITVTL